MDYVSRDFFFNASLLLLFLFLWFRCFSYIGKWIQNGQNVSIGAYCDELSIVEHEILHALGFFHEQSRYDRNSFVTIQFDNIQEGWHWIEFLCLQVYIKH